MVDLREKRGFIFDLDGVVYIGDTPVEGARETLTYIRKSGRKVCFLTNNASKSRRDYVRKLNGMGIGCSKKEVLTSAYGLALYLRKKYKKGKCVVIGESGLNEELRLCGFEVVSGKEGENADFVAVGIDRRFDYDKLKTALRAVRNGARFVAANLNPSKLEEDGIVPGAGAMVAALEISSGVKPEAVIGKPNRTLFEMALTEMHLKKSEVAKVGDVLDVDIAGGNRFGIYTVLVLTGIAKKEDLRGLGGEMKPKLVLNSIEDLRKRI